MVSTEQLTRALEGQQVAGVTSDDRSQLTIHFSSGVSLAVKVDCQQLVAAVIRPSKAASDDGKPQPTKRQLEYLAYVSKYMAHFGRAPAEPDIQQNFMVSAPTVNQMMQNLERRGYISRQKGVPRSIRKCIALTGKA